jgi:hypothetical protein
MVLPVPVPASITAMAGGVGGVRRPASTRASVLATSAIICR